MIMVSRGAMQDLMLDEGMAWLDLQAPEPLYWIVSLFKPPGV